MAAHPVTPASCARTRRTYSISALAFNMDGTQLAIAASYTYEKGEQEGTPPDAVTIRTVADKEVLPKKKGSKAGKK